MKIPGSKSFRETILLRTKFQETKVPRSIPPGSESSMDQKFHSLKVIGNERATGQLVRIPHHFWLNLCLRPIHHSVGTNVGMPWK